MGAVHWDLPLKHHLIRKMFSKVLIVFGLVAYASASSSSANIDSALAFMERSAHDDICGVSGLVFVKALADGKSRSEADKEATLSYRAAYANGARVKTGSPCEASEIAYKKAHKEGREDPNTAAAHAFIQAFPGDEPCAASAKAFTERAFAGASAYEANYAGAMAFIEAAKTTPPSAACTKSNEVYLKSFAKASRTEPAMPWINIVQFGISKFYT